MSEEEKGTPPQQDPQKQNQQQAQFVPPRRVFVVESSADEATIIAINEQHRRQSFNAALHPAPFIPPPPRPIVIVDDSADAAMRISIEEHNRRLLFNATLFLAPNGPPPDALPGLLSQAVVIAYDKTREGQLIWSITPPLLAIIERIMKEPSLMHNVGHRKWEEIIAATYDESGLFDEVTLTPQSGDRGRDVIAVKHGFGSVRLIESVKRYSPGARHRVTAEEVQALLGVFLSDPQATKGIVSTTGEFAPMIRENPHITQYIPHRLELVDGAALLKRLAEYTMPKSKEASL